MENRNFVITKLIEQVEQDYDLQDLKVDDHLLWPLFRFILLPNVVYDNFYFSSLSFKKSIRSILRGSLASFLHNRRIRKSRNRVISVLNNAFFTYPGGISFHKLLEPITSALNHNGTSSLFLDPTMPLKTQSQTPTLLLAPRFLVWRILALIRAKFPFASSPSALHKFLDYLDSQHDITISTSDVKKAYYQVVYLEQYLEGFLKKCNPDLGLVSNFYGMVGLAFTRACNHRNIPVVDIQHGLQGPYHFAYNLQEKQANVYGSYLPTHFWLWTQNIQFALPGRAFWGGHPWFFHIQNDTALFSWRQVLKASIDPSLPVILITLQSFKDFGVYDDFFKTIRAHSDQFNWIIRAHPTMTGEDQMTRLTEILESEGISSIHLKLHSRIPLYVLLEYCDLHVTAYSSVVLEAAIFEIPSLLLMPDSERIFYGDVPEKFMLPGYSVEDIKASLGSLVSQASEKSTHTFSLPGIQVLLKILAD